MDYYDSDQILQKSFILTTINSIKEYVDWNFIPLNFLQIELQPPNLQGHKTHYS